MIIESNIWAALAAGLAAGAFFFGALLWTLTRLPRTQQRALLLLASFILRAAVVAAGAFLFVGRWQTAVAYLAGFFIARLVVVPALSRSRVFRAPTNERARARSAPDGGG